jgi:hypothetical protein
MIDERFIMHRYKATRLAMLVGIILMGVLFFREYIATRSIRYDLFGIMLAMAVAKVGAMLYYRRTN